MKTSTKILRLAATSCLLFTSATMASSTVSNKDKGQQASKLAPIKLLSVFQSQDALLKHIKGNHYEFSFSVNKNSKVLVFSDRPKRIAYTMSRPKWAKMVMTHANSFRSDPPNISLTWANPKVAPKAYTILKGKFSDGKVVYQLEQLGGSSAETIQLTKGTVSVFIDYYTPTKAVIASCQHDWIPQSICVCVNNAALCTPSGHFNGW